MLNFVKKHLKNEAGQAVVELALTLPILLMILCGIIDFGWLITNQNAIDHSAREGARYAIVHATDTGAVAAIQAYTRVVAPDYLDDTIVISVSFTNTTNPKLGDVIVAVSDDVNVLTPIVGVFTNGQKINLSSSCRMKVE